MATTQKAQSGGTRSAGAARGSQGKASTATAGSGGATVNLPYVTAEFHRPDMPDLHVPDRQEISGAFNIAWENLPSREVLGYWAGLGVLAAFSLIEWPVAAAIGVGTVVAQRAAREPSSGTSSSKGQSRSGSASA